MSLKNSMSFFSQNKKIIQKYENIIDQCLFLYADLSFIVMINAYYSSD